MADRLPRKLAAILYADVAGYSRLTGEDEDATHRTLSSYLDLISTTIESHGGQVMHYAGDAILAKFNAIIDAMSAAVAIQDELSTRNKDLGDERKVQFRIGVNLGDVIEDRDDIYGDGVNVAARLESLADPGGICISEAVRGAIGKKLTLNYEDLGAQEVKNIEQPVRAYRVLTDTKAESKSPQSVPEVPDKPSIAVLPFANMSSDPEQEFFADGITEDITTELSREKDLFVIARNSTFVYKGKSLDIRQVAQELGVKYVLEGSVRKVGSRVRLNAQLIEAQSNRHIWAERYDRALEDIFEVQDELTRTISTTLLQKFRDTETERALRKTPRNLSAYDHYLRAFGLILGLQKGGSEEAIREARKALDIEPDYARAFMILAWAHAYHTWSGRAEDPDKELVLCREAALKAVSYDKDDFWGHGALAFAELFSGNHERALNAIDQAVVLSPNSADSHAMRGIILNFSGDPQQGLEEMELALRLNPNYPHWYLTGVGRALFLLGRYEEAIPYLERLTNAGEDVLIWQTLLIANYMAAGRTDQAQAETSRLLESRPDVRCEDALTLIPLRDEQAATQYVDLLKAAGVPG